MLGWNLNHVSKKNLLVYKYELDKTKAKLQTIILSVSFLNEIWFVFHWSVIDEKSLPKPVMT